MNDTPEIGDEVTYTPKNTKYEEPVTGHVAEILNDGKGYKLLVPLDDDPANTVRVWTDKGTITKTGNAADWKTQPKKKAEPEQHRMPYKHPSDLASEYKRQGISRAVAWDNFVRDTILLPRYRSEPVDAKVFYHYYDLS